MGLYWMRNSKIAIAIVSLYLLVFTILSQMNTDLSIMLCMFFLSPFLVSWMVYTVLRYGTYSGKELKENEEWGYEDYYKEK